MTVSRTPGTVEANINNTPLNYQSSSIWVAVSQRMARLTRTDTKFKKQCRLPFGLTDNRYLTILNGDLSHN